jgi:hypothetical protein
MMNTEIWDKESFAKLLNHSLLIVLNNIRITSSTLLALSYFELRSRYVLKFSLAVAYNIFTLIFEESGIQLKKNILLALIPSLVLKSISNTTNLC